jgi:hypothetical protein
MERVKVKAKGSCKVENTKEYAPQSNWTQKNYILREWLSQKRALLYPSGLQRSYSTLELSKWSRREGRREHPHNKFCHKLSFRQTYYPNSYYLDGLKPEVSSGLGPTEHFYVIQKQTQMHSVERHLYPGPERMPSSFSRAMSNI